MHFGNITKSNELRKITNLKFTIAIKSTQHQHLGFVDIDTGIFNNKKIFGVLCPVMPPSNKRHTEESNRELLRWWRDLERLLASTILWFCDIKKMIKRTKNSFNVRKQNEECTNHDWSQSEYNKFVLYLYSSQFIWFSNNLVWQ